MSDPSNTADRTPAHFQEQARDIIFAIWEKDNGGHPVEQESQDLIDALMNQLAAGMATAAQNQANADYYRSLVVKCGEYIGPEAYTQDDGSVVEDVLCAKVPELVRQRVALVERVNKKIDRLYDGDE